MPTLIRWRDGGAVLAEDAFTAVADETGVPKGDVIVSLARFQQDGERSIPGFRLDPALERAQVEKLQQVRASRSQSLLDRKMAALERAARDGSNSMPLIVDAAEAYATVGEISDRLSTVFGEYRE